MPPKPRNSSQAPDPPDHWKIESSYQLSPNITLNENDVCKIKGEQGLFKFKRYVTNEKYDPPQEWIDLYGGTIGYGQWRSVHPSKVVHIPKKRKK